MPNSNRISVIFQYLQQNIKIFILLFGAVLYLHCAYLNTFYNAKMAFKKAFDAHMELKHSEADTADAPPDEILIDYDRTIDKSTKVVDIYPKRTRFHDDAMFLKAKATYYKNELPAAIRRFKQFQKEYQKSPFIPESYLFLSKAYLDNDNLEKAEETLRLILEKYPKLNDREEITMLLAHVAIKREGKSQAIMILEESLSLVKSDERKLEIILKLCVLYIDLKLYDKAVKILTDAPRNKDFQNYLFRVDYNLLICYKEMKYFKKALSLAEKMLKNSQYVKQVPKVLLEKGIVLNLTDKIKEAIKVFEEVTAGSGTDVVKGRAWYELALIYQHVYGDFKKAKECFEQVLSLSADEILVDNANRRIQGIDQRETYLNSLKGLEDARDKHTDTTDTAAMVLYKLGEIYWLNLSEPDSALQKFAAVSSDTSINSALMMKSLYAQAWILNFVKQDTAAAAGLYNKIIEKYPATMAAQKSQQDLGIPITVKTREDSARLAFIEAERFYFERKKPVAAVNAYYKAARKYSDMPQMASSGLYAAAWLCDNVLNKNKKALMLYRILCDSFPESDLCLNEAQPRIKVVEDTLKILAVEKKKKKKAKKSTGSKSKKALVEDKDTTAVLEEEDVILSEDDVPADTAVTEENIETPVPVIPEKRKRQKIIRKRRRQPNP